MTKRAFGHPDPLQDKRRVLTSLAVGSGLPPVAGEGGALENKIYLWPTDGSTITTFDPDQAGLIAALAAAVAGDMVWLPSIEIALTSGITVGAGVVLCGISLGSILAFSGFTGTAITMAANSICDHFIFTFTPSA